MKTTAAVLLLFVGLGCNPPSSPTVSSPPPVPSAMPVPSPSSTPSPSATTAAEPEHITVQHILISFTEKIPKAKRSQAEAKELAAKVYAMVNGGSDFGDLVKQYTDDSFPGIYRMANRGVKPLDADEHKRTGMVPAFGNVGFKLPVGGVGLASYDPADSQWGWHIIKRIK